MSEARRCLDLWWRDLSQNATKLGTPLLGFDDCVVVASQGCTRIAPIADGVKRYGARSLMLPTTSVQNDGVRPTNKGPVQAGLAPGTTVCEQSVLMIAGQLLHQLPIREMLEIEKELLCIGIT